MVNEAWKDIPGFYPYQASDQGRIRRSPDAPPKRGGVPGKVLSVPGRDEKGYPQLQLHDHTTSRRRTVKVHRLVALAFLGPRVGDMTVNHINGNKENNTLPNLEYVTRHENSQHAKRLGLIPELRLGRDNWNSGANRPRKLTPEKVREIRRRIDAGEKARAIAADYGVHEMTIGEIKRREIWAWA